MINSQTELFGNNESRFWRTIRGDNVFGLDGSTSPIIVNEALGPDRFWNQNESVMCFGDIEVGLDETNELKSARYFGLYPGKTSKGRFSIENNYSEPLPAQSLRMGNVLEFLIKNSCGFAYDKTLDSESTDRGIILDSGGSIHFMKRRGNFYLSSAFLKRI